MPKVSIILVNYNGLRWLKLFLSRLLLTNYPEFEIVVVDNASSDDSVHYLKENFNVQVVNLQENKGFAVGNNIGAKHSTGRILAFLNNDMEVNSDWLMQAVIKLTLDNSIGLVQCKIMRYDRKDVIDCLGVSVDRYNLALRIGHGEVDQGQYDDLKEIGAADGGAMVIWKDLFERIGGFDSTYFMYGEDADLCWRARLNGFKILPATSSIVYHVGSATSKLSSSGEWNPSPFFAFHLTKNYVYCWLKNFSTKTILIYWPIVLFMVLGMSFFEVIRGRKVVGVSHLKGLVWNIRNLKLVLRERRSIQRLRKTSHLNDDVFFVKNLIEDSTIFRSRIRTAQRRLKSNLKKIPGGR